MTLRPFNPNDAETILSWCKDKHAFQLWSADRYKDFPAQPEEMMEQYEGGSPRKKGLISQMLGIMREEAEKRGNTVETEVPQGRSTIIV